MSAENKAEYLPNQTEKRQGTEDDQRIAAENAQKSRRTRDPRPNPFEGPSKNRRQGETMDEPGRRQKRLVEGKQQLRLRDIDRIGREITERHDGAKHHHRDRKAAQDGTVTVRESANPVWPREQEPEDIDKLPCEWVEEPCSLDRPGRQIHAEYEGKSINHKRYERQ